MKLIIATEDYITETLVEAIKGKLPKDCKICVLLTNDYHFEKLRKKIWCPVVEVPIFKSGRLGQTIKHDEELGYRSAYPEISKCLSFEMNEDVILACGGKNGATYLASLLQEFDHELDLSIHLLCTMPLNFEGRLRNNRMKFAVKRVRGIRSLFLHNGEELVRKRISLFNLFKEITEDYAKMIIEAITFVRKFGRMNECQQFYFDRQYKKFILLKDTEENKEFNGSEFLVEPEDVIACLPREGGKNICETLRAIRQKFVADNMLDYNFEKCNYTGPCAGSCEACELEAKEILQLVKERNSVPLFKFFDIGCGNNGNTLANTENSLMGVPSFMEIPGWIRHTNSDKGFED